MLNTSKSKISTALIAFLLVGLAVAVLWRLVRGNGVLLTRAEIAATEISPNADGDNDITTISYALSRSADISISFTGSDGIKHYFRDTLPRNDGDYSVLFSGVVDGYMLPDETFEGEILARLLQNDTYEWVIAAVDANGQREEVSGTLVIADGDVALPEVRNFSYSVIGGDAFTPNQDGLGDRVKIGLFLPKESKVRVFLLNPDGVEIHIPEKPTTILEGEPGRHEFDYDAGVDVGATPPESGTYPLIAEASDAEGQRVRVADELTIDLGGVPYASIISPTVGDTVAFSATTVAQCDTIFVTMTVENYGETPIRTTGPFSGEVYDSDANFNSIGFPTESGAFRLAIGYENAIRDYPFRWALGTPDELTERDGHYYLEPGQRVTVTGGIRMVGPLGVRNPQPMWGGLIHEDVAISQFNNRVDPRAITIEFPDPDNIGECSE